MTLVTPPRSASAPPQSPAKRVPAALHHAASTSSTGITVRGPTISPQRPVSKLYTAVEPGLFSTRPEAYVHPEVRGMQPRFAQAACDFLEYKHVGLAQIKAVPLLEAAIDRRFCTVHASASGVCQEQPSCVFRVCRPGPSARPLRPGGRTG